MEIENNPDDGFELVRRDSVPVPQPQPDASLEKRIANLRTWLQPTSYLSPGNEFIKHLNSYAAGTGQWSHSSAVFQSWSDPDTVDAACLHARGVAGSGKSVFAANTIRELQDGGRNVLFFFFRQIVDKNHAAKYLVRDFAAQLLPHCPALVAGLTEASQQHGVDGNEMDIVWPALVEALSKRGSMPESEPKTTPVYCVVDALDEMDDEDFDDMVQKLVALGAAARGPVKILMTSRPLPKIENALSAPEIMHLKLDPDMLVPDVARYVNARMASLERPLNEHKTKLVRNAICKRASGLFLHARLAVDNLAEGLRDGHITEETLPASLENIPSSLREVYEDMLREHARRSSVTAEQQAKILMCVTHASRPLRLIELGSLVSRLMSLDLRQGKELVRASCGRLLEILEDESVSVIHHSFTEFLHDKSRRDNPLAFPVLEDIASHIMLTRLSLEYLDSCPPVNVPYKDTREEVDADEDEDEDYGEDEEAYFENAAFFNEHRRKEDKVRTEIKSNNPLMSYVTLNLVFHLSRAAKNSTDELLEAMDEYFGPQKPAFQHWLLFVWSERPYDSVNLLHLATGQYEECAMPLFLMQHFAAQNPHLIDSPDGANNTPLFYAASRGYEEKVDFLLANGADAARAGYHGLTPMHIAVSSRQAGIVKKFLDIGIDPLIKTAPQKRMYDPYDGRWIDYDEQEAEENRETALSHAFRWDNTEIIAAFLPFIPTSEINSFFHRTTDVESLKALLDTGKVDIDCYMRRTTRLFDALASHSPEIVKLLLERGANPMKRSRCGPDWSDSLETTLEIDKMDMERGRTPLHGMTDPDTRTILLARSKDDAAECLRLMIAAGADINATADVKYSAAKSTPLHLAVQKGQRSGMNWGSMDKTEETLTELLLAAGADPTAQNADGDTPIHVANAGKPILFKLLMEHGGGKAKNARGRPPLHEMINSMAHLVFWKAMEPNVEVFKMLLDQDDNGDLLDNDGNNIFHHIMHSMGALLGMQDTSFIAELLGRAGPDALNKKNKKGYVPLWRYKICDSSRDRIDDEDENILRMMVNAGMDVNMRNDEGQTILWHIARFQTGLSTIKKFVRLGVDPKAMDNKGETLLHEVVKQSRDHDWISFLVSLGLDAKHTSVTDGNTLIHTVLSNSDNESRYVSGVLESLVEAGIDPLATNNKGQTALHLVRTMSHLDLVLQSPYFQDLNINRQDHDGFTPLHNATSIGSETAIHTLIQRGADPTLLAADGASLLHIAARDGYACPLDFLLAQYRERGILGSLINSIGAGRTPLHHACQSGVVESIVLLLQHGADPSIVDDNGLTPLHAVAEIKSSQYIGSYYTWADEIVGLLHEAGADLEFIARVKRAAGDEPQDDVIDAESVTNVTPMDLAVANEAWNLARALLSFGVKPSSDHLQSPQFVLATDKNKAAEDAKQLQRLHESKLKDRNTSSARWRGRLQWRGRWASSQRKQKAMEVKSDWEKVVFVAGGQTILGALKEEQESEATKNEKRSVEEVEAKRMESAYNALTDMLRHGDYDSIHEYAELTGDIVSPCASGSRANFFHCLVRRGHIRLLEHFSDKIVPMVRSGKDFIRTKDEDELDGSTLLEEACGRTVPSLHLIKLLVERFGADANAGSPEVSKPIHILAVGQYFWHIEALQYFLDKGADINSKDRSGYTPLLLAVKNQNVHSAPWSGQTARLLLQHGADPNIKMKATMGEYYDYSLARNNGLFAIELSRRAEITQLLLDHGAKLEYTSALLQRNIKDDQNPDNIKCLLSAGLDPNKLSDMPDDQPDLEKNHPNHERIVRYALHEAGLPTNRSFEDRAYDARQEATIDVLLSHGADPSARYPDGSFVLQRIMEDRGRFDCLVSCLPQMDLNLVGSHGRAMLASACKAFSPMRPSVYSEGKSGLKPPTVMTDAILALLNAGPVDTLVGDEQGQTPLHLLCDFKGPLDGNFDEVFCALIEREPKAVSIKDSTGRTPLQHALHTFATKRSMNSTLVVRHLIKCGADITQLDPLNNNSALHYIAMRLGGEEHSAAEAATLFRELVTDSNLDINARNTAGEAPCSRLCDTRWDGTRDPDGRESHPKYAKGHDVTHAKALDIFVELGADLMTTDCEGRNLLHVTAARELSDDSSDHHEEEDLTEVFKKLMELGVDPKKEDDKLRTALDLAVARDLTDVVNLFSKKKNNEVEDSEESESEADSDD